MRFQKGQSVKKFLEQAKKSSEANCAGIAYILNQIETRTFIPGTCYHYSKWYSKREMSSVPEHNRTPEECAFQMSYGRCHFYDVPANSRTREFFLNAFTNEDVFEYIQSNIQDFDRQFFKDLIATNEYCTHFSTNCFEIMPLDYIDDEMIGLAILISTNWVDADWFKSLYKRKPDAIPYFAWICAARLYTQVIDIQDMCPEKYKDELFYLELFSCTFNVGMTLSQDKRKIMDKIPEAIITPEFLLKLLSLNTDNIARITEKYMNTILDVSGQKVSVWQLALLADPKNIQNMELTEKRISFFTTHYGGKGQFYYDLYIKDKL